jgi:hypothetical protein
MSFQGVYSFRFAGKGKSGTPDDGVGVLGSDGKGTVTGLLTENKNGTVCQSVLTGSYTVNPNGTASITVRETPSGSCSGGTVTEATVLYNMGTGAAFVNTTGAVELGTFTSQKAGD